MLHAGILSQVQGKISSVKFVEPKRLICVLKLYLDWTIYFQRVTVLVYFEAKSLQWNLSSGKDNMWACFYMLGLNNLFSLSQLQWLITVLVYFVAWLLMYYLPNGTLGFVWSDDTKYLLGPVCSMRHTTSGHYTHDCSKQDLHVTLHRLMYFCPYLHKVKFM